MNKHTIDATICIVPRERHSCAVDSLINVIENTEPPYRLVYVDAHSPTEIAKELETLCRDNGFSYLRKDHYLSPNKARNIALDTIDTKYVAFIDNDLFVQPRWLQSLIECANETNTWAVGPVVLEGSAALPAIHMAGGIFIEEEYEGFSRVRQKHRHMYETLASVKESLRREPVGSFEFHCVLVRTGLFGKRCYLDEGFVDHQEHLDLAREIRLAGGPA